MRRDLFDCVFNVAKKETRSWTEKRGRILCSSNATWKPRIWFLPGRKSQPKIDRAYIVFVKSLYEYFSSHRTYSYMYLPESHISVFCKTLLTPRRLIVLNDVGKLEEWHLWVRNRASAFSLVDSGGYAVGQLDFWTVLLWMINSGLWPFQYIDY